MALGSEEGPLLVVIHECGLKKGLKKGPSAVGSYLSSSLGKISLVGPIM